MKPTLYLDVDDSLLYHPYLYNFINRCCKMNNGEYEINQKENTLKNTCNLFKDNYKLPINKDIVSRLIKLSDKVNLAIIEDAVVENHMFNYIDEESIEVLIDILPLLILLLGFLLKVSEEVALHLFTVKEIVPFVYYTLETTASDGFAFFHHAVIVVTLTLILWLGVDVDAK